MEDDYPVAPWIGPTSYRNVLSVVLMSWDMEILKRINSSLFLVHAKGEYPWKIHTTRVRSILDVKITEKVGIDFIVIALDTSKVICLEWARMVLKEVHPDLLRRRVVVVNASGSPIYDMAVDANALLELQEEWDFDLLNANVCKKEDAMFLAKRLLNYFSVVLGVKTGIPNLHI